MLLLKNTMMQAVLFTVHTSNTTVLLCSAQSFRTISKLARAGGMLQTPNRAFAAHYHKSFEVALRTACEHDDCERSLELFKYLKSSSQVMKVNISRLVTFMN